MKDNIPNLPTPIVKLGNDIVYIPRIVNMFNKFGFRSLNKILVREEIDYCISKNNQVNLHSVAKRFAAKEATVKALGIGFGEVASFKDIAVINNSYNKPYLRLSDKIKLFIKNDLKINNFSIDVTISDDQDYALSTVVLIGYANEDNQRC